MFLGGRIQILNPPQLHLENSYISRVEERFLTQ